MNEFQKCPVGFIDIGGICVPKERVVRKSDNYGSLFGKESATHNVPGIVDIQDIPDEPWDNTPTEDLDDQPMTPAIPNNPYQEEEDEYEQSQDLVDDDNRPPAVRPVVPDHNVVVTNNEPLTEEQMEIDFIMDILFREQNTANLSQDQLQVLANANAEELLSVRQRAQYISYISYLDDVEMSNVRTDEVDQIAGRAGDSLHTYTYTDPLTQEVTSGTYHLNQHGIILYNEQGEMFKQYRAADATFSDNVIYNNNLDIDLPSSYTYNPSTNQNTLVNDPLDYVDDAIHEVGKAISNAFDPSKI